MKVNISTMLSTSGRTLPYVTYTWLMAKELKDFAERLVWIINQLGTTPHRFAKTIGIPNATLSTYLNDGREPKVSFISMIRKKYPQVNIDWLLLKEGDPFVKPENEIATELKARVYELEKELHHLQEKEHLYERMFKIMEKPHIENEAPKPKPPSKNGRDRPG